MCLPDVMCRLTAGLSVSFQRPFVARHRPEWQLRPVCLCLKQWALFPELNIEMCIRDNRCDLCMGMEYPPAFACAFCGTRHIRNAAHLCSDLPLFIVCVGTTASAGLSVFVTLSIFCWNHVVDMHGRLLKRNSVFWSVWMPAYWPMPTFSKQLSTTETRCIRATMPHVSS